MRNLEEEFKNKSIDYNKLLEYGFVKEKHRYIFKNKIYNDQFEIIVDISENKKTSKLIDIENEDEYILVDIEDSIGEFVGNVRNEYENKLQEIVNKCTTSNIFKNIQLKQVINYIKEKYNDELEFLWKKYDDNAIWRNKQNNKWYGLLLTVSKSKLGIDSKEIAEIIDLRYQKLHKNPDEDKYPCYKVLNSKGELAEAFVFGGKDVQRERLEKEGIKVINNKVDLETYGWKEG